ncbi:hypothetical protein [Nocardia alba]|uniref:PH (Pleckstrin Homology) domain-containing protein n=1 Tax=Nocardia alba TaxID=225051 RepID=A0A4R1G0M8_9NOCA|nr:hypothetical protein [Nocardia alba]TCJ99742.1 hypothetical protein DFR71_0725 [Nocardia alba]
MRPFTQLARSFVRFEVDIWVSLARAVTRRPDTLGGTPIRYAGAVSATFWAFIVVSAVEIPAVHLLIPWPAARIVALGLGIWGLVWMIGMLAAHHMHPHVLTDESLRVRYLRRVVLDIAPVEIRAVRHDLRAYDGAKSLQLTGPGDETLTVIIGSATNIRVILTEPRTFHTPHGDFTVGAVAFWADDAQAAVAKIRTAIPDRAA